MSPSPSQHVVRQAFRYASICFTHQPESGGVIPPNIGPRGRDWWYNASNESGLFYYDYFIQQSMPYFIKGESPPWCVSEIFQLQNTCYTVESSPDQSFEMVSAGYSGKELSTNTRCYFGIYIAGQTLEFLQSSTRIFYTMPFIVSSNDGQGQFPIFMFDVFFIMQDGWTPRPTYSSPGQIAVQVGSLAFSNDGGVEIQTAIGTIGNSLAIAKQLGYSTAFFAIRPNPIMLSQFPEMGVEIKWDYFSYKTNMYLCYYSK